MKIGVKLEFEVPDGSDPEAVKQFTEAAVQEWPMHILGDYVEALEDGFGFPEVTLEDTK